MLPALALLLSLVQPVADTPAVEVTPEEQATEDDDRARAVMEHYFQHLSGPDVLSQFERDYADFVDFYGKVLGRNAVLREKARFVQRWPDRSYHPRKDSMRVTCVKLKVDMVCGVTGLVDFQCRSSERHAVSIGVANFRTTIAFIGGRPQIVGEESAVVG